MLSHTNRRVPMMDEQAVCETTSSLLEKNPNVKNKRKTKLKHKRTIRCVLFAICLVLFLTTCLLVLCFADFTLSLRNYISQKLGIKLPDYRPPETLESLSYENETGWSEFVSTHLNNSLPGMDIHNKTKLKYIKLAESTWKTAWQIYHDREGWRLRKGSSLETGMVHSKSYRGIGTVNRMQGYLECSPDEAFGMLVEGLEQIPEWSKLVQQMQILEKLEGNVDIYYAVTTPVAGGAISSRDYVNIRKWRRQDNLTITSACSTSHPEKPNNNNIVRAKTPLGSLIIKPVPEDPDRCLLETCLSINFGGWVPQWLADQAAPSAMMDSLAEYRTRAKYLKHNRKMLK